MKNQKPLIVGITGGIGSGKTTVCNFFKTFGIPVYHADVEAKALMNRSKVIRRKLISLFGDKAYKDDMLNRSYLRAQIFRDEQLLAKMNAIVHPKVGSHFSRWLKKQNAPYILKEVAIIFENNLQNQYDYIITIIADEDARIRRVIKRDNVTESSVRAIISNQLNDEEKVKLSDFTIKNNDLVEAKHQVNEIHSILISKL